MVLNSADTISGQYFSALAGTVIELGQENILGKVTERKEYNLIHPDGIRRLPDNTALLIAQNHQAMKINIQPHYQNKLFKLVSQFKPVNVTVKTYLETVVYGKREYIVDTRKEHQSLDRDESLEKVSKSGQNTGQYR